MEWSTKKKSFKVKNRYKLALQTLGYKSTTHDDVDKMVAEIDLNKNDVVEFAEFLKVLNILIKDDEELKIK